MASRSIDLQATLAQAYASIEKTMPTNTDRLRDINNDISNFNTQLALSQMSGQNLTSSISGLQSQIQTAMNDQQKSMKILAGVQMFEQYRKIREQMVASLEDQNRSIDQQTTADAAASGYVRQGDVFVKPGKDGAFFTAINAYTYFDVQGNMSQELSRAGFAEMSSDAMQNFLSSKSEVEMDSYFSMQKTALQVAMENITGHGSQTERKKSQDTYVIGTFNKWAGSAGDSNDQFVASHVFANDQILGLGFNSFLTGGFGELGSGSARPGGAPYGFYVQLALSGYSFNQEGARRDKLEMNNFSTESSMKNMELTGGTSLAMSLPTLSSAIMTGNPALIGSAFAMASSQIASAGALAGFESLAPIATMINQFNPLSMIANAKYNVDYGHRVLGKGEGYMMEAQEMSLVKAPLIAGGSFLVGIGIAGAPLTGGLSLLVSALGALIVAAGNSMQVNTTTGERIMKMTDQAAVGTALGIIGGAAGGGFGGETGMMVNMATGVASAGFEYDAKGHIDGYSLSGAHGDAFLTGALNSALAAAITKGSGAGMFGQVVGNSMIGTGLGVLEEYGKQQMGYGNHFNAFSHTGLEGLGGLAAAAITGLGYEAMQSPKPYDPFSNSPTAPNDMRNMLAGAARIAEESAGKVAEGNLFGLSTDLSNTLRNMGNTFINTLLAPVSALGGLLGKGYDAIAGLFRSNRQGEDVLAALGGRTDSPFGADGEAAYDAKRGNHFFPSSDSPGSLALTSDKTQLSAQDIAEMKKSGTFLSVDAQGQQKQYVAVAGSNGAMFTEIDPKTGATTGRYMEVLSNGLMQIFDGHGGASLMGAGGQVLATMGQAGSNDRAYIDLKNMGRWDLEERLLDLAPARQIVVDGKTYEVKDSETGRLREIHFVDGVAYTQDGQPYTRVRFTQRASSPNGADDFFNIVGDQDGIRTQIVNGVRMSAPFGGIGVWINEMDHGGPNSDSYPYIDKNGNPINHLGTHDDKHGGWDEWGTDENNRLVHNLHATFDSKLYLAGSLKNGIFYTDASNTLILVGQGDAQGYMATYTHGSGLSAGILPGSSDVKAGDYIGRMGDNGYSGGTHLHFQAYQNGTPFSNQQMNNTFIQPFFTDHVQGNTFLQNLEWQMQNVYARLKYGKPR